MDNDTSTRASAEQAPEITVRDNEVEDRFELFVDGAPAGFLAYQILDKDYALNHTEIDPEFEGRGMGSKLISGTLEQIRSSGHGVLPFCPFVLSFLQRHSEYLDLVSPLNRKRFDLAQ